MRGEGPEGCVHGKGGTSEARGRRTDKLFFAATKGMPSVLLPGNLNLASGASVQMNLILRRMSLNQRVCMIPIPYILLPYEYEYTCTSTLSYVRIPIILASLALSSGLNSQLWFTR